MDLKKSGSSNNRLVTTKGTDHSSKSTSKSGLASKAQTKRSLYMEDEEEGVSSIPERTVPDVRDSKARSAAKQVDDDVTSKPKPLIVPTKPSKVVAHPDSESDFDVKEAPLKSASKAKSAVKSSCITAVSKTRRQPQKRQFDSEQSVFPPPARKRAKAAQPPNSNETLVGLTGAKDEGDGSVIHRAKKTET